MNNISPLINSQLSDRIVQDSPLFGAFIELYYRYCSIRENSIGSIQNRTLDFDIDTTLSKYVDEFYSTYGKDLPKSTTLDKRIIVKLLSDIYNSKGTEKSVKLLFRVVFGIEVEMYYPGENILRASGGIWDSESFITLEKEYGEIESDKNQLIFTNLYGSFLINSYKIDKISETKTRFYYRSYSNLKFDESQLVIINQDEDTPTYVGRLIKSPSSLIIIDPGADWQVGQIVTIPGTIKNTIGVIKEINENGGIKRCDIIDYGFDHYYNQTTTISPYSNKPIESFVDIQSSVIGNTTHYTININDYIDGIKEVTNGVISGPNIENKNSKYDIEYFAENYGIQDNSVDIQLSSYNKNKTDAYGYSDVDINIWLASRALITIDYQNVVNTNGYYSSDIGLLSNNRTKLQDNYFYQLFSYVIESSVDIADFKSILNVVHPAGTKMFFDLSKNIEYNINSSISKTNSVNVLNIKDTYSVEDAGISGHFTKIFENSMGGNGGIDDEWGAPEFFEDDYEELTENLTEIVDTKIV